VIAIDIRFKTVNHTGKFVVVKILWEHEQLFFAIFIFSDNVFHFEYSTIVQPTIATKATSVSMNLPKDKSVMT